jgi:hypothetical protein
MLHAIKVLPAISHVTSPRGRGKMSQRLPATVAGNGRVLYRNAGELESGRLNPDFGEIFHATQDRSSDDCACAWPRRHGGRGVRSDGRLGRSEKPGLHRLLKFAAGASTLIA